MSMLLVLLCGLISVGWLTLLERLVLGGSQIRMGASKVGFMGILQPLLDGIKLITKQLILPSNSSKLMLLIPGGLMLIASTSLMYLVPSNCWYGHVSTVGLLFLLSVSSLPLLISGLVTNSQYAYLGSMRVVVLTLSYEVVLFPLIIGISHVYSLVSLQSTAISVSVVIVGIVWMCCVIEANRAPFDLAEGESELISGYHIEHGGMGFTMLFLGEYLGMVSFSFMFASLLFNSSILIVVALLMSWLLLRASLPRVKMDQLLHLCWVHLIPLASLCVLLVWW